MFDRDKIIEELKKVIKKSRFEHTLGVEEKAVELCSIYGEDTEKGSLAALLHDYAKYVDDETMLQYAERFGIEVDDVYAASPNLLHGPVGAELVREKLGITDDDILNAIRYHTVGRPGMSLLEKIIYIADMTEKGRDFEGVGILREASKRDIDEAMILCIDQTVTYTLMRRKKIHINSIQTYNYIIETNGGA